MAKRESTARLTAIGPYQIQGLLGSGASGDVYKAFDPQLKRHAAIKILAPELRRDKEFLERFTSEAAAIAQLHHRNIVQIYFIGEEDDLPFFAMQFIDGPSLADVLQREEKLTVGESVRIMLQVLDGLSAAHAAGMVHRDVKPANILLAKSGQVFLADFGLVKSPGGSQTVSGVILGTPDYLAPEQAKGKPIDERTDLYAVGAVFYRMLSGRNLFQADNASATIYQLLSTEPAPLSSLCNVPPELEDLIHRLLKKNPQDRYATASEVRRHLAGLQRSFSNVDEITDDDDITDDNNITDDDESLWTDDEIADDDGSLWEDGFIEAPVVQQIQRAINASTPDAGNQSWWQRLVSFRLMEFSKKLPARMQQIEQTQHLADDAIRDYELRCSTLQSLIDQAEQVSRDLENIQRRKQANANDAARSRSEVKLDQQMQEQNVLLNSLREQFYDASATLTSLQSQKKILLARLNAARASTKAMGGMGTRKSRTDIWMRRLVVPFIVLVLLTGFLVFRKGHSPSSEQHLISTVAAVAPVPKQKEYIPAEEMVSVATDNGAKITNTIGMELVRIPAGEFMMGSPRGEPGSDPDEPQHLIRITQPFYIGVFEVTVGQFASFVKATGYKTNAETGEKGGYGFEFDMRNPCWDPKYNWRNSGFDQTENHPVCNVTWNDAQVFLRWLSDKENILYRLPTEAEWEYACRAGTQTMFQTGWRIDDVTKIGNIGDLTLHDQAERNGFEKSKDPRSPSRDGYVHTAAVGSFPANPFGLHDMTGNVAGWCSDWFFERYYQQSPINDPTGPANGVFRVFRGGFWGSYPQHVRSADRSRYEPDYRDNCIGFRVVRSVSTPSVAISEMPPKVESIPAPPKVSPAPSVVTQPQVAVVEPRPEGLLPDPVVLKLPEASKTMSVGGRGRFFIFQLGQAGKLAIVDVVQTRVVHEINGVPENALISAGAEALFIAKPSQGTLEKWSFEPFARTSIVSIPSASNPYAIRIGTSASGPLLIAGENDSLLVDADTFKIISPCLGARNSYDYSVNISADGRTVTGIVEGLGPMSWSRTETDNAQNKKDFGSTSHNYRWHQPTADGSLVLVPGKIFDRNLKSLSIGELADERLIATVDPRFFLAIRFWDDLTQCRIWTTANRELVYTLRSFKDMTPKSYGRDHKVEAHLAHDYDSSFHLLPEFKLFVTIGWDKTEIRVYPFDLDEALNRRGEFLYITSNPPLRAARGSQISHQVEVLSNEAHLSFELQTAAEAMTLTETGLLTWNVPVDIATDKVPVLIRVAGKNVEAFCSFDIEIE